MIIRDKLVVAVVVEIVEVKMEKEVVDMEEFFFILFSSFSQRYKFEIVADLTGSEDD